MCHCGLVCSGSIPLTLRVEIWPFSSPQRGAGATDCWHTGASCNFFLSLLFLSTALREWNQDSNFYLCCLCLATSLFFLSFFSCWDKKKRDHWIFQCRTGWKLFSLHGRKKPIDYMQKKRLWSDKKTKKSPQASRKPTLKLGTPLQHTESPSLHQTLPTKVLRECAAISTAFLWANKFLFASGNI